MLPFSITNVKTWGIILTFLYTMRFTLLLCFSSLLLVLFSIINNVKNMYVGREYDTKNIFTLKITLIWYLRHVTLFLRLLLQRERNWTSCDLLKRYINSTKMNISVYVVQVITCVQSFIIQEFIIFRNVMIGIGFYEIFPKTDFRFLKKLETVMISCYRNFYCPGFLFTSNLRKAYDIRKAF